MPASDFHAEYVLRLADSTLVLGQRLAEWCGHGPMLEEDIALTNVALDLVGQARLLLSHAALLEDKGRDEDALAYFRDESQFRNWTLLELPNGDGPHNDYAVTIARNLMFSALAVPLWEALAESADQGLAQIAAKSVKESRAHLRHASEWTVRLGDGTQVSHDRMQAAFDRLWPYANEWWDDDPIDVAAAKAGIGPMLGTLKPVWDRTLDAILAQASLARPAHTAFLSSGKLGRHSEHLGYLLAEMQSLARSDPGAQWCSARPIRCSRRLRHSPPRCPTPRSR